MKIRPILLLLVLGCASSHRAATQAHATHAAEMESSPAPGDDFDEKRLAAVDQVLSQNGPSLVLLGARHDLTLQEGLPPNCECLAFGVGAPSDPRFVWDGPAPSAFPADQVVVAFRADPECLGDQQGPSYRGYLMEGSQVVLLLEPAAPGRPELHGAVLPKPPAGGGIVVRAADPNAAYAKGFGAGPNAACTLDLTANP